MHRVFRAIRSALSARGFAALAAPVAMLAGLHTYTVHAGDSLSSIAQGQCHSAQDWTGIDKATGGIANPDLIYPGQKLKISCTTADVALPPPAAPSAPQVVTEAVAQTPAAPVVQHASQPAATYSGSGSMQSCIIARESGGNSQVFNATGHYGLYQFSASTWAAHGGNPADFGHASVSEQNAVYAQTVADDGYSDWSPYDGC